MDVIIEKCSVIDIVAVIDTTCETLTSLLDAGHGYKKYYVLLLEALLKLLTSLKDVEVTNSWQQSERFVTVFRLSCC